MIALFVSESLSFELGSNYKGWISGVFWQAGPDYHGC